MINTYNSGNEHLLKGFLIKSLPTVQSTDVFPSSASSDIREYKTSCCNPILVFADSGKDDNQNDVYSFMYNKKFPAANYTFFLQKDSEDIAALNDNTYGIYYSVGSITNATDQLKQTGYKLLWSRVLAAHGEGIYRIRINSTTFGPADNSYSEWFDLKTFSQAKAEGTIRIKSIHNGELLRTRLNYKGLDWTNTLRVRGYFGNAEEEVQITNDIYQKLGNSRMTVKQRKSVKIDIYSMEVYPCSKCVADDILNYHFFADKVFLSDFNASNYDYDLVNVDVYKEDSFDIEYPAKSRKIKITGKLKESIQDNEKRLS